MKKKKLLSILIILVLALFTTGCREDNMDGIDVVVTNYANEYIISKLYGSHANISSIYPDGVDVNNYKVTKKMLKDVSSKDLFIYNGLIANERSIAVKLLDINSNLKIIDTAYVLEEDYTEEELWLNPSSLLMMAKNVQMGLDEYIDSTYLKTEVSEKYEDLKIILSELDADYRLAVNETKNKTIIVNSESLKYLEKFGLTVICIDDKATDKTLYEAENLIENEEVSYIINFSGDTLSSNAKKFLEDYDNLKELDLHRINNLTDKEREEKQDYITLMNSNLEQLKQELYQ